MHVHVCWSKGHVYTSSGPKIFEEMNRKRGVKPLQTKSTWLWYSRIRAMYVTFIEFPSFLRRVFPPVGKPLKRENTKARRKGARIPEIPRKAGIIIQTRAPIDNIESTKTRKSRAIKAQLALLEQQRVTERDSGTKRGSKGHWTRSRAGDFWPTFLEFIKPSRPRLRSATEYLRFDRTRSLGEFSNLPIASVSASSTWINRLRRGDRAPCFRLAKLCLLSK